MSEATPVEDRTGRTVAFVVAGAPWPKERARARIVQPKGKRPFIQHYTPKETADYEETVGKLAKRAMRGGEPITRPIELQVTAYVEIPDSWPEWKRRAAVRQEVVPTGKPDLDNVVKSIQDGMNGIVYADDSQVVSTDAVKLYAPAGATGYVEVAVRENYRCGSWIKRLADLVLLR